MTIIYVKGQGKMGAKNGHGLNEGKLSHQQLCSIN